MVVSDLLDLLAIGRYYELTREHFLFFLQSMAPACPFPNPPDLAKAVATGVLALPLADLPFCALAFQSLLQALARWNLVHTRSSVVRQPRRRAQIKIAWAMPIEATTDTTTCFYFHTQCLVHA